MGTSNSLFALTWPGFPGLWMGWAVLLAIRYGIPAVAGNNSLARAAVMPAYTRGQHHAARLHSLTALLALVMSLFVRVRWTSGASGASTVGPAVPIAGLAAAAAGLAAYAWAFVSFSRTQDGVRVTRGLFRVLRHPMFVAFCVAQSGLCVLSGSVPYALIVAAHVAATIPLLRAEERWCRERWG